MQTTVTRRIKRVKVGDQIRTQVKVHPDDEKEMKALLKSISNYDRMVIVGKIKRDEEAKRLQALMTQYGVPMLDITEASAAVDRPKGRATNIVDPRKFHDLVEEDDFFDSIKVSIEKAKKCLSGRELEEITETIPAKLGDPCLVVTLKDVKALALKDAKAR